MRRSRTATTIASRVTLVAVAMFLLLLFTTATQGQQQTRAPRAPSRWELAGVPALNYDADEGFGYGAILELYNYGDGVQPYRYTIQPTLFRTTEGRQDITLFFDAPALLPGGWRASAFVGRERQLALPYYGIGNQSIHDASAEEGANPYFYRFGRTRFRATADLQHRIGSSSARLLLGAGLSRATLDLTPFDSGTTLLARELGGRTPAPARTNYLRAGLVWDTRDREIGPHRGTWAEALVQRSSKIVGATDELTRWTATVRQYVPISRRLTFAQRVLLQGVDGDVPVEELATIQSSFKQQDGLGGSGSVRGLPKDRYVGRGIVLSNSELRWRAAELSLLGRDASLSLSAFLDAGRVWSQHVDVGTALRGLHAGYGGGVRLGFGSSFIVAADVGHSSESTAPVYVGLGWMF